MTSREKRQPCVRDGTDWNRIWKERMRGYTACCGRDPAAFWDDPGAARKYWQASREDETQRERIERTVRELDPGPGDRVLDVGAGPGVLTVPLARAGCRVTAVEPSKAMMSVLREQVETLGLREVDCLEKRWEDVARETDLSGPFRTVVCCASLVMENLEAAVRKMERVCSGTVHIYWFAGTPSWDAFPMKLWPRLHGTPYRPMPRGDVLYNVLYGMGIHPEIAHFPFRNTSIFSGLDEAVSYFAPRYRVENEQQRAILREALDSEMEHGGGGRVLRHTGICMRVRWSPQDASPR